MIDAQETAYDVNKVVSQLEEYEEELVPFGASGIVADMIEVVKDGGMNE